jgi:hypothetical protein
MHATPAPKAPCPSQGFLDVLLGRACRGDVTALRLALGSTLHIKTHQLLEAERQPLAHHCSHPRADLKEELFVGAGKKPLKTSIFFRV